MMPSGPPASLAMAPEATAAPIAAAPATARVVTVSFHKEQERRRRETWRLSLICLLLALALGLAMSAIVGPLLLAIAGGVLKLAALIGCGDACSHAARGIGAFARDEARLLLAIVDHGGKAATLDAKLAVAGELIVFARVLAPALIAAAVAWIAIRRSLARAGMQELVSATHARPARRDDGKERQLITATDEMAIAAGLLTPRVMVIDSGVANAVVAGSSHESATLLVTRGLIDRLDRDQIQAVAAHCVAAIGNGDQRIMQSLLATFQTLGLFHTILDLPFRWSAWRALGRFARATFDPRVSPTAVAAAARGIEATFAPESIAPTTAYMVPLLPLRLVTMFQRLVLTLWCALVVSWPLALMWRARRYLADAAAVQLSRNPDALASALSRIATQAGIPAGGEHRDYLFMWGVGRRTAFDRYGVTLPMHPRIDRRLKRLVAMGATMGAASGAPAGAVPDALARLRRVLAFAIFGVIMAPFVLIGALFALAGIGTILSISMLTVLTSLLLGLGFLSWAFGA